MSLPPREDSPQDIQDQIIRAVSEMEIFDEWFEVDELQKNLLESGFDVSTTGHERLADLLLELPHLFQLKLDLANPKQSRFFATFIGRPILEGDTAQSQRKQDSTRQDEQSRAAIASKQEQESKKLKAKKIIESISDNWKLDAKLESKQDYFYHLREVKSILNKSKYYVIGRKGSGKSSISEFIYRMSSHDVFTEKLSFKNFPFNELYSLDNPRYTPPNQYITLWKYLIYTTVVRLMARNESVDARVRDELNKIYSPDPIRSLARTVNHWTSAEFGASILGTGGTIKLARSLEGQSGSWIERVNFLEDIIVQHCDESSYYIIFDELDEDYRSIKAEEHQQYNYLLTSLFKAVQDIKSTFSGTRLNVCPIVFLRDDIYSLVKDADKNKWRDFKIEIEWNSDKIKELLAYRISRDAQLGMVLPFQQAWELIFHPHLKSGNKHSKQEPSFDYICRSTHMRPRDFIRYIQACAEESASFGMSHISSRTIRFVDRAFSNYLKDEIVDEVYPVLPDIEEIFQVISNLRKWLFTASEFKHEYNKYLKSKSVSEENVDYILDTLFRFGVLGNQSKVSMERLYFKYMHTNMNINKDEKLVVHRGLFKALQIF